MCGALILEWLTDVPGVEFTVPGVGSGLETDMSEEHATSFHEVQ